MTYATILNSIGLLFDIIGVLIIFKFSPDHFMSIDGGNFNNTPTEEDLKKIKKTLNMKRGFLLIEIGFLFQIINNFF